ncbi:MAG: hypothetical protein NVS1B4_09130 [Gemmatimonadaceae bacterium]
MRDRFHDRPEGASDGATTQDAHPVSDPDASDTVAGDDTGGDGGSAAVSPAAAAVGSVEQQLVDQREKYLRLAAEYDNFRKRTAKERMEAGGRAQAQIVKEFVDALDDLGRFAHVDPTTVDARTVVEGVELVERKLMKALTTAGLLVLNPVEEPFDPSRHEAVGTEPALSHEDDHLVARVYQQGYLFNGQLLRPARVVVRQWPG